VKFHISSVDFYWLIGLLEGEGSFTRSPPSAPNRPSISLQMTDEDVVLRAAILLKTTYYTFTPKNRKHKVSYLLHVRGAKAVFLMGKFQPHMSKRRQNQIQSALASYDPNFKEKMIQRSCKLTGDILEEAKQLLKKGASYREVGRHFGINHETVRTRVLYKSKPPSTWLKCELFVDGVIV
jgi:hypothetical protein